MAGPEQISQRYEQGPETNPWLNLVPHEIDDTVALQAPETEPTPTRHEKRAVAPVELTLGFDSEALSAMNVPPHLEPLRETLMRFPERLDFQPGPTLIFGPNGSGKTTLATSILYALEAAEDYRYMIDRGRTEEEAQAFMARRFEMPGNRGTDFENFLAAGMAPHIAKCMKLYAYTNNTYPKYCNTQEEVGRVAQIQRDMARQMGRREAFGPYFEPSGNQYDNDYLASRSADNASARQTVDETLGQYLRGVFDPRHLVEGKTGGWGVPSELSKPREPDTGDDVFGFRSAGRQRNYAPGIAFIDEPETGLDPRRHIKLPETLGSWYPEGSILIVPSNSVELFRSPLPRIDLSEPEKGIHIPENHQW